MRGEQAPPPETRAASAGTPPRAWGTVRAWRSGPPNTRYTPTCVGNRLIYLTVRSPRAVHPHVRGEQRRLRHTCAVHLGTPPRAWGTGDLVLRLGGSGRYTPTCVGNRAPLPGSAAGTSVHPHVRGEQLRRTARSSTFPGTPPRAWGTAVPRVLAAVSHRYTPTCVGNRLNSVNVGAFLSVAKGVFCLRYVDKCDSVEVPERPPYVTYLLPLKTTRSIGRP